MKIRSITCFIHPGVPIQAQKMHTAGQLISLARPAFEAAGYEVQTARLATVPFPHLLPDGSSQALPALAQQMEQQAQALGFDYISLGPALPQYPDSYAAIPPALAATQNVFFTGLLTQQDASQPAASQGVGLPAASQGVSLPAARFCAEVIHQAAAISPDGFANLRFAALANVPAGAPFFPAAYHAGEQVTFALAMEAADLAVQVTEQAGSLAEVRQLLVQQVEEHAGALVSVAHSIQQTTGAHFGGIDFTLAPYPEPARSIGTALENLGLPAFGWHGSLAASAFLTSSLDQARFPRTGFNGLMLPVLEDSALAARAAEGCYSLNELLLYSAVCGTGLDTVPLPGDCSVEQLYAVLLDLAALALRLDKPLTARLMPIPGKRAGDPTDFDFAYFANSRVLPLRAGALSGKWLGEGAIPLASLAQRANC